MVTRFKAIPPEQQEEYRTELVAYRNLYAFLSQIIPFHDSDLEKLYAFVRFLLRKLPRIEHGPEYDFGEDIALKYYRIQKVTDGTIVLEPGKGGEIDGPTSVGTASSPGVDIQLSRLIDILNDRFGTEFKPADQLFFDSIKEDALADPDLRQAALANSMENFGYVFKKALEGLFIDRMEQNEDITAKFMNEKDFQALIGQHLLRDIYERFRSSEVKP